MFSKRMIQLRLRVGSFCKETNGPARSKTKLLSKYRGHTPTLPIDEKIQLTPPPMAQAVKVETPMHPLNGGGMLP